MEIIVGIIVGLLSGTLGSVLYPVLTHRLGRRQREEERVEQRHAQLRLMIEERLADARHTLSVTFAIREAVRVGLAAPQQAWEDYASGDMRKARYPWQPHRIDDERLQELATRLNTLVIQLGGHIGRTRFMKTLEELERLGWLERSASLCPEIEDVTKKIDLRLDEVDW